jgi:type I restriction enzyme S subunit
MRTMRDSGVLWAGETPNNWERLKIGYLTRRKRVKASDLGVVTAFRDGQVTLRSNRRMDGFTEATEFHGYQLIRPGQLAVHRMDAFAGAIGVSDSEGMCSPVLTVLDCDPKIDSHYLALYLREAAISGWIEALAKSIRERTSEFGWNELSSQMSLVPPIEEQKEIVSYLRQETSQIDLLISKKEQLIEKLLERRQALITHVVTKGLDPNVPMKDSGVEWIGVAPKNWESLKVGHLARRKRVKAFDLGVVTAFRDGQVTLRSNRRIDGFTEATEFHGYQLIKPGQLAVHRMDAFAGAIGVSDSDGMCSPVLTVLDCNQKIDAHYLALFLRLAAKSGWIEALAKSIRERTSEFGWNELSSQQSLVPPIGEQRAIVAYLTKEASQIDTLVQKTKRAVQLLKERRQALITQVVTGKIDVRGFAGGNS